MADRPCMHACDLVMLRRDDFSKPGSKWFSLLVGRYIYIYSLLCKILNIYIYSNIYIYIYIFKNIYIYIYIYIQIYIYI